MGIKKLFLISIFAAILLLFSCKKEEEKIESKYEYVNNVIYESQTAEIDFYNFKHHRSYGCITRFIRAFLIINRTKT